MESSKISVQKHISPIKKNRFSVCIREDEIPFNCPPQKVAPQKVPHHLTAMQSRGEESRIKWKRHKHRQKLPHPEARKKCSKSNLSPSSCHPRWVGAKLNEIKKREVSRKSTLSKQNLLKQKCLWKITEFNPGLSTHP